MHEYLPPQNGQEQCYSGHKRKHVLKFQTIMVPCGLIANLYGPMEGRRHDVYMWIDCQPVRTSGRTSS